jgi:hypothetical protein
MVEEELAPEISLSSELTSARTSCRISYGNAAGNGTQTLAQMDTPSETFERQMSAEQRCGTLRKPDEIRGSWMIVQQLNAICVLSFVPKLSKHPKPC